MVFTLLGIDHVLLKDQLHPGRPSTSLMNGNIAKIHELILEDRHWTFDELVDKIDVS